MENDRLNQCIINLYTQLLNLVTAVELGVSTETLLECSVKENSYLGKARNVLTKYEETYNRLRDLYPI